MQTMPSKTPCEFWQDLLFAKLPYENRFYTDFVRNRRPLVNHLDKCTVCEGVVTKLDPLTSAAYLSQMSDADLATTLSKIRNLAIIRHQNSKTR